MQAVLEAKMAQLVELQEENRYQYTPIHPSAPQLRTVPICCLKISRGPSVWYGGPGLGFNLLMMLDLPVAQQMVIPARRSGGYLTSTLAATAAAILAALDNINGLCNCC
jgi:hypothetical protein